MADATGESAADPFGTASTAFARTASGRTAGLGSAADRKVFGLLRELALVLPRRSA